MHEEKKKKGGGRKGWEGHTFGAFLTFGLHSVVHTVIIVDGGVGGTSSSFGFLQLILGLGASCLVFGGGGRKERVGNAG